MSKILAVTLKMYHSTLTSVPDLNFMCVHNQIMIDYDLNFFLTLFQSTNGQTIEKQSIYLLGMQQKTNFHKDFGIKT